MRFLVIHSDAGGCYTYRVKNPMNALNRYGVEYEPMMFLPHDKRFSTMSTLINLVYNYDAVIIQRHFELPIAFHIRQACTILGKKLIFETDDDYINVPDHHPSASIFLQKRIQEDFKTLLTLPDLITVSTEELKRLYSPYNKNIVVLPNNIENVHYFKDFPTAHEDENGKFSPQIYGKNFLQCPAFIQNEQGNGTRRALRIGYTANTTHRVDFKTIQKQFYKAIEKIGHRAIVIYTGDKWFEEQHKLHLPNTNHIFIDYADYDTYLQNIRNFDIGIAPLEYNYFNMSKSPIKAIEYASWGVPSLLPNYITYDREFVDDQTAVFYDNSTDFYDKFMTLANSKDLRERIGNAGRLHVQKNRLEKNNAPRRMEVLADLVGQTIPLKLHKPETKDESDQVPICN